MHSIKRLASTSIIYGVGSALTKSISLLALPVFTKYLSPAEYGVLSLILLLSALIQPIIALGLNTSMGIAYFSSNTLENKSQTVWSSFILLCLSSIIFILITYFLIEEIAQLMLHSQKYNHLILITIIFTCLNAIVTPFMLKIQFENQAKTFVILSFLIATITVLFSIYFVVYSQKSIAGIIYGQFLASIFSFFVFIYFAKKDLTFIFDMKIVKKIFKLGYPLIPSSFFLLVILQSNRYILEWFEGVDAVGIYSIGFSFGMLMNVFVSGFTQAWYPYFMSFMNKQDEIGEKFANILYLYIAVFGFISLLFFIFAKTIIEMFVSIEFYEASQVIGLVAMSQFFIGIFSILTPIVYYNFEVKYISILQSIVALLSIPINIIFIYYFGSIGAGIGLCVSIFFMALLQFLWNELKHIQIVNYNLSKNSILLIFFLALVIFILRYDNIYLSLILLFLYTLSTIRTIRKSDLKFISKENYHK